MIKPSDPAYERLMNYQYYRLVNTSPVCLAAESKKLRNQVRMFQAAFKNTKFNGEDPILVFDLLTTFVVEADTLRVSEAHTFLMMPKLFKS